MSKTFEEITEELKVASAEMVRSLENDELADAEKEEWYGYLRALRDIAYFMDVSEQTKAQDNLSIALKLLYQNCQPPREAINEYTNKE